MVRFPLYSLSLLRFSSSFIYAVYSDLGCIVAHDTVIKYFRILPDILFLFHFYAN